MRLIARTKDNNTDIMRLMIYESEEGIFLFGYSTMIDSVSKWDSYFDSIEHAKESAMIDYNVDFDDWIQISDPDIDCQHDWIGRTQLKRNNNQNTFYSKDYELFLNPDELDMNLKGMTMNERLFHTGLLSEYDVSKSEDSSKAQKIIIYLTGENNTK